jgi:hypothetical protein
MKRLKYYMYLRGIKIHLLSVLLVIIFISCKKDDYSNQTYLGKQNSVREYETTTWKYDVNSTMPFIKVPDSFYKKLSYDSILISEGLVINAYTIETVIPYNIAAKIITKPEVIKSSLNVVSEGQQYSLEDNLFNIFKDQKYLTTIVKDVTGPWLEDSQQLSIILSDSSSYTYLAKPLHVGDEWIRESRRYRNSNGVYELFQQECKVLCIERVIVKAGEFSAFKVEVMNHWVDIPSKSIRAYEYYTPDVGLVLKETDGIMSTLSIPLFGETTISTFHQKVRRELVNYSIIKY